MGFSVFLQFLYLVLLVSVGQSNRSVMKLDHENDTIINGEKIYTSEEYDKFPSYQWYNPVLQNHSALLEYLVENRRQQEKQKFQPEVKFRADDKTGSRRKKRSVPDVDCTGLCSRSLCPWNEEWDDEPSRIPRFIKYADCASTYCDYNMHGTSPHLIHRLRQYTYCDKVRTDILVLEDDEERWLTNWPIACICARHPTFTSDDVFLSAQSVSFSRGGMNVGRSIPRIQTNLRTHDPQYTTNTGSEETRDGLRMRTMTREQRRHLRHQVRRIRQRSESFEELMARRRNQRRRPSSSSHRIHF